MLAKKREVAMRYQTTGGKFVTAESRAEASALAAQYGFGDIAAAAPAPAKPKAKMSVARAVALFAEAQAWPQCGENWPCDAQQRAAQAVIAANPGCTDHLW